MYGSGGAGGGLGDTAKGGGTGGGYGSTGSGDGGTSMVQGGGFTVTALTTAHRTLFAAKLSIAGTNLTLLLRLVVETHLVSQDKHELRSYIVKTKQNIQTFQISTNNSA